jgi:hypothetical protein
MFQKYSDDTTKDEQEQKATNMSSPVESPRALDDLFKPERARRGRAEPPRVPIASTAQPEWLTGLQGTGVAKVRPLPASRLAPNTFILNRSNQNFAFGNSRRLAQRGAFLIFILMLLILGGVGVFSAPKMIAGLKLNSSGVASSAIVSDLYTRVSRGKSGTTTNYYVNFRFRDSSARTHTIVQKISSTTYRKLARDMEVPIRYVPDDPKTAELSGPYTDRSDVDSSVTIWLAVVAFSAPVMFFSLWNYFRTLRLQRRGEVLQGRLTNIQSKRYKGNLNVSVTASFTSPSGRTFTVKDTATRNDLKPAANVPNGTPVAVVYVNDRCYRLL